MNNLENITGILTSSVTNPKKKDTCKQTIGMSSQITIGMLIKKE